MKRWLLILIWLFCGSAFAADQADFVTEIRGNQPGWNSYTNPWFATRFYINLDIEFNRGQISILSFQISKHGFRQASTRDWYLRDLDKVAWYEGNKELSFIFKDKSVVTLNLESGKLTIEEAGFKTFTLDTVQERIARSQWHEKWRHIYGAGDGRHYVDSYFESGRNAQSRLTGVCARMIESSSGDDSSK